MNKNTFIFITIIINISILILIGTTISMYNNPYKDAIDDAIEQCEQSLPRDQIA